MAADLVDMLSWRGNDQVYACYVAFPYSNVNSSLGYSGEIGFVHSVAIGACSHQIVQGKQ